MPPVWCLPTVELLDTPLPSPGVPDGAGSPVSTVLSGRYDFLPLFPPRFVALTPAVPSERSPFARSTAERCRGRSSGVGHPVSPAGLLSMETTGSPTFLGNPHCALALLSDPGRTGSIRPIAVLQHGPHSVHGKGSCTYSFRGSITRLRHWLSTLRRPGYPDTTQDSFPVAGQAFPDGLHYPQGSNERFRSVSYISASFPKFSVAQGRS